MVESEHEDDWEGDAEGSLLPALRHGIGLATDLYDLTIINAVRPELEACYGPLSDRMNGAITSATSLGAMLGQLGFGYSADVLGRRGTFVATAVLLCVSAAGSACARPMYGLSAYQVLLAWRFLLGVGVGGEYPLSTAVTAEHAGGEDSAKSMAMTYSMFQVGQLLAPVVVLLLIYGGASMEATWRVGLGVGAVLALIGAVLRAGTMRESQAWLESRAASKRAAKSLGRGAVLRGIGFPLLGTALTWFVYDVVSWGVGSYTSSIFASSTRAGTIWYMLLINVMATPGFVLTFWMGVFGRRAFQLVGFLGMALCLAVVGVSFGQAPQVLLVIVFGLQKIFDAAGPGATTFIIPGEIFPTRVRASCHGISAAAGKLGAFVGMYNFPSVEHALGFKGALLAGAMLLLVGFVLTLYLTPPYTDATLIQLQEETQGDVSQTTKILWSKAARLVDSDSSGDSTEEENYE